jgi:hypothetical protein
MAEKPKRDRRAEYERRRIRQLEKANAERLAAEADSDGEKKRQLDIELQLKLLDQQTRNNPNDADGDIDFAYRHMALPTVVPSMAPSMAGWQWYLYARDEPNKFLDIYAKREDAKAKMAGTITNQRMEDDKRQQFAILDRIEKQLTIDVRAMVDDLMLKFPREVLRVCKNNHKDEWDSFHAEECQE